MTHFQFFIVLALMEVTWVAMWFVMQKKVTVLRFAAVLGLFAVFAGTMWLGLYWNHTDLTCHLGQHCFPWGY